MNYQYLKNYKIPIWALIDIENRAILTCVITESITFFKHHVSKIPFLFAIKSIKRLADKKNRFNSDLHEVESGLTRRLAGSGV